MSNMQFKELPLGRIPAIDKARAGDGSDLAWAWEAIDVWYGHLQNANQSIMKALASFIMLACMYIPLRVAQLLQGSLCATDGAMINYIVNTTKRALWARIKAMFDGQPNWFDEVVSQAKMVNNALFTNKEEIAVPWLHRAFDIWRLLKLDTGDGITTVPATCTRTMIKEAMRWLQHQLDRRDINLMKIPSGKWTMPMMDPYDTSVGIAPIEGRTKAPGVLTAKDLVSLMPREWVTDSAVDGYMALLCHSRNGHFQDQAELPTSPESHAWVAHTAWAIRTGRSNPVAAVGEQWPPALYSNAKLEDVGCHFFPVCDQDHWFMVVLRKLDGKWVVEFFSSALGFDITMMSAWELLKEYLYVASNGNLDVRYTIISRPRYQPRQDNDDDCGVFVLGAVRQELVDRKLEELTPSTIPAFRKRITFELQCWKEIA